MEIIKLLLFFILGLFFVYLSVRIIFYGLFKSWWEAKDNFIKENFKDGEERSKKDERGVEKTHDGK